MAADARSAADWRSPDDVWLDHVTLRPSDVEWLQPVRSLTMWAVKVPDGLLARLPSLEYLDLRGGSGTSVDVAEQCRRLRYLQVNQVRGVADLSVLPTLTSLELLSLYGLPQVAAIPSLASLTLLRRVELGSMKGLSGLTGVHDAPALREVVLSKSVGVGPDDAARLASSRTLTHFLWYAEDVPNRVWVPFVEAVGKPPARTMFAKEWLDQNG
jgi:hypothetical protein